MNGTFLVFISFNNKISTDLSNFTPKLCPRYYTYRHKRELLKRLWMQLNTCFGTFGCNLCPKTDVQMSTLSQNKPFCPKTYIKVAFVHPPPPPPAIPDAQAVFRCFSKGFASHRRSSHETEQKHLLVITPPLTCLHNTKKSMSNLNQYNISPSQYQKTFSYYLF